MKPSPSHATPDPQAFPAASQLASPAEWRAQLTPAQFAVLREAATEPPSSGEYNTHYPSAGVYRCIGCEAPLYTAGTKFDSGCGWPAFFKEIEGAVTRSDDLSIPGRPRVEIKCAACEGHLGHVFRGEGFTTPTDERHCVNSIAIKYDQK